jgi:hypothetical protein
MLWMGKSTISTAPFSIAMFVYQRVPALLFRTWWNLTERDLMGDFGSFQRCWYLQWCIVQFRTFWELTSKGGDWWIFILNNIDITCSKPKVCLKILDTFMNWGPKRLGYDILKNIGRRQMALFSTDQWDVTILFPFRHSLSKTATNSEGRAWTSQSWS